MTLPSESDTRVTLLGRLRAGPNDPTACQETLNGLSRNAPGPTLPHIRSALSDAVAQDPSAEADALFQRLQRELRTPQGPPPEVEGYEILGQIGPAARVSCTAPAPAR